MRGWLIVGIAVLLVAGCGDDVEPFESKTPEITTPPAGEFDELLLDEDDLGDIDALRTYERSPQRTGAFEDPDPRGPCGAKVSPPGYETFAIFQSRAGFVASAIMVGDQAIEYFDDYVADTIPGCADHTRGTNLEGVNQTQRFIGSIDVADATAAADGALAVRVTIQSTGPEFEAIGISVRVDDTVSLLSTFPADGLTDEDVVVLAERMTDRLTA